MAITHGGDIFAIAREQGWDWRDVLDFSANINPLGPSPRVKPAICRALDRIVHYPDREPARLRTALAALWNLQEDQLLFGNGATELIFFLARVLPTIDITLALPVFSEFNRAFPSSCKADLMDRNTWPNNGLLVFTRPANPTGWTLPLENLRRYLDSSSAFVLVDESFLEFSGLPSAATLIPQHRNLIVLRSLTKFYALPGLRIGALIGDAALVDGWRKQREPWQVNVLAEEAALAALDDADHTDASIAFVRKERDWLLDQIRAIPGTEPAPTDANFLFVRLGYPAAQLRDHLLSRKILIRDCTNWPGTDSRYVAPAHGRDIEKSAVHLTNQSVRIAVRRRHENERLLDAWSTFPCA